MVTQGKLFVVSAPSGAGKTTLVTTVIERLVSEWHIRRVITYTTKQPRLGEVPGKDYHFIPVADFKEKVTQGFFIEWSTSYGYYYGSPRYILNDMAQGMSLVLVIDRAGARQIYVQLPDAILIWISTKDLTTLKERLLRRGTEDIGQIRYRLRLACEELEEEIRKPLYHYHILNDDFERALGELGLVVFDSLKKKYIKPFLV